MRRKTQARRGGATNRGLNAQVLGEVEDGLAVALEAHASDGLEAGRPDVGHLAEVLAFRDLGDVHLDAGERNSLYGIEDGDRGVRICRRVDDDTVVDAKRSLDLVDD